MTRSAFLKSFLLLVLLTLESSVLSFILFNFAKNGDFFSYQPRVFANIIFAILALLYTYSLTIGGWKKWEQYVLVPLPIATGIFLMMLPINVYYAIYSFMFAMIFISYDVMIVNNIKNQLIKFNPIIILRYSTRGILFVFSVLAGIMVIVSASANKDYNISGKVAEIANKQFKNYFESRIDSQLQFTPDLLQNMSGASLPVDISNFMFPEEGQSSESYALPKIPSLDLDIEQTIQNEVENLISPYMHFVPSIIGLIVFTLIRFLGSIANLIFNLTIWVVFLVAGKINFIHTNYVMVKKEEISFDKPKEEDSERQENTPN